MMRHRTRVQGPVSMEGRLERTRRKSGTSIEAAGQFVSGGKTQDHQMIILIPKSDIKAGAKKDAKS